MAKKKTKGTSAIHSPSQPPQNDSLAIIFPYFATAVLAGGLSLAAIAVAAAPQPARPAVMQYLQNGPGAFAMQTQLWLGQKMALESGAASKDITALLPQLIGRAEFVRTPRQPSMRLRPLGLLLPILEQLGVGNPWQAIAYRQRVEGIALNRKKVYAMVSTELLPQVQQQAQDAVLFIEGGRATEFQPDRQGKVLDIPGSMAAIERALFDGSSSVMLPRLTLQPRIRLSETNALGINELVARGESDFSGSPKNRVHNISVGSERFNGLVLQPGQEFSFNQYLGEVTAEAGFKPELVIKTTGTVPELGGGLCQVSTTAFRAALYGGLPITARRNHSYAVKYYAPQGTDATIYPGVQDFKFINDTAHHLLIATRIEGNKLIFEFYGTSDNREVSIEGPYQYERQENGAMKARLTRTVVKNDAEEKQEFFSKYVSKDLFPTVYEFPKAPVETAPPATPEGQPVEPIQTPVNPGTAPAPLPETSPANQTPPL